MTINYQIRDEKLQYDNKEAEEAIEKQPKYQLYH